MRPHGLAIVTPWFGENLTGGAERLAFQVARAMADRGHRVEVFATCGRSFQASWSKDAMPAGTVVEGGVTTHRFALDARDAERFDRANAALLAMPRSSLVPEAARVSASIEAAFVDDGIRSRALEEALRRRHHEFDRVLFVPYLYGPTLFGLPLAGERTALQPCLHDESYAYLPRVAASFHGASRLLFNGEAERELARSLYGPAVGAKGDVVGHWIEPPPAPARRPAVRTAVTGRRYLLYLGRRDRSKNVHLLVRAFQDFRRYDRHADLRLVLAGPGATSFHAPNDGIVDLGFVGDEEKWSLLRRALAVVQPSEHESFSRAMMEAWSLARPVVVHARCAATASVVAHEGGGLVAASRADWTRAIERLARADAATLAAYGDGGRRHFLATATPAAIAERYERALFGERPSGVRHDDADADATPFDDARRAPHPYDARWWDRAPDAETMRRLANGRRRIAYAGHAIGPADACEDLLAAFAYLLSFGVDGTLAILGTVGDAAARATLRAIVERHGLADRVEFDEAPTAATARAYLRSSHLYCSLADRPSSLVAFEDASAAGLPIVAFAGSRVAATLGDRGLVLTRKDRVVEIAALLKLALSDAEVRVQLTAPAPERLR